MPLIAIFAICALKRRKFTDGDNRKCGQGGIFPKNMTKLAVAKPLKMIRVFAQPINDLRIGVFYDDGGEKFGGDIVYVYNFAHSTKAGICSCIFARFVFAGFAGIFAKDYINDNFADRSFAAPTLTSMTTTIPVMTITNIIGNFITLTNSMTAAGLTLIRQ